MYYVYLLENPDNKSWYIGYTSDLKRRVSDHNSGNGGQTTSRGKSWKLIYYEAYLNKPDALGREKFLKKQLINYLLG